MNDGRSLVGASAAGEGRQTTTQAASASAGDLERTGPVPVSVVFGLFPEEFMVDVVRQALDHRPRAGRKARQRLDERLRGLSVPGFRNASRAKTARLEGPVVVALAGGDDALASAVLKVWEESDKPLRDAVVAEIEAADMPVVDGLAGNAFPGAWTFVEWLDRQEAVIARLGEAEPAAVGLMLAIVAGRMPLPPPMPRIESARLRRWIEELEGLPLDAPEWDDVEDFASMVFLLASARMEQRDRIVTDRRDEMLSGLQGEYEAELRYLGVDLSGWANDSAVDPLATLALAAEMETALASYRPLRPQAETLAEETGRAAKRREAEAAILEIPSRWEALPREDDGEDTDVDEDVGRTLDEAESELGESRKAVTSAIADRKRLEERNAALEAERDGLRDANASLRLAKGQMDEANGSLRQDLDRARTTEEHWRTAYIAASRARATRDEDAPEVDTVSAALSLAERAFPDALVVSLNGKSKRDMPYAKPAEVFDALAWLATCYRDRDAPDIGRACSGWFHKPDQSESTVGMYRDWYQTSFRGRTLRVTNHIGKGTSFDPRNTIRIGFTWDEEANRVVIGYVGQHQRNRNS